MNQPAYFIYPALKRLQTTTDEEEKQELRRLLGASVGNVNALRIAVGIDPEEFAEFYPDMRKPELSTVDTISEFTATYGKEGAAPADLPMMPECDYAATFAESLEELPAAADDTSNTIDAFLNAMNPAGKQPAATQAPEPAKPEQTQPAESRESSPKLSESLAAMMIRNGNYSKALEILTAIRNNNPEAPYYIADQIRFLRKAIALGKL